MRANYWLVIGTYSQDPDCRAEESGITSQSLHPIPMENFDTCKKEGEKITNEIYKAVWQFDSKWTCIFSGKNLNNYLLTS